MNPDIRTDGKAMIDVASLFKRCWGLFVQKPIEHVLVSLIVAVLGSLTLGVLLGPLYVGQLRMIEKQQRGESISVQDAFSGFDSFAGSLIVTVCLFVGGLIGTLLLVLPGLVVIAAWSFAYYFVARDRASAADALSGSWNLLKTQTTSVLLVLLLVIVVNCLAATVVLASLLVAPLSAIFCMLAFQDMTAGEEQRVPGQFA
ncbi:MAG TPA: hypothetical protein VJU61_15530 [Polyangiaceae bacterium]|nr:hypothetical protein [Polyangiaceae bacterium]